MPAHNVLRFASACALMIVAIDAGAVADVIAFDDAYAALGQGGDPNLFYPTPHFIGPYFGLVGGIGNGDPGNWSLQGTNGPAFWGFNVDTTGGLTFANDVINFSLDVSRSNGSSAGIQTFSIQFYNNGLPMGSSVINLGSVNVWSTVTFNGTPFDEVQFQGSNSTFSPFGIDNIHYTVPAPAALWLLGLTVLRRNRQR